MDPLTMKLIATGASQVQGNAPSLTGYMPGTFERQYRKQIKQDARRLRQQKGGLSQGQISRATATGLQPIQGAVQQRKSELARQAGTQVGQSGMRAQSERDLMREEQQAIAKLSSNINQMDIDELKKAQDRLQQQRLMAASMEGKRRLMALKLYDPTAAPEIAGEKGKELTPTDLGSIADM